jgi:DNA-binding IclR family transcriptional regulator
MFFSPGLEQLDPALLAFVKCHVTSPVKWEVMRTLANQDGAWISGSQLARSTHRQPSDVTNALKDLSADGIVEVLPARDPDDASYRLPADEPTSVVLHRLIEVATHSQELRAIIAAHLQHIRQQTLSVRTSTSTAAA